MSFNVKVIADSRNGLGNRLTTMVVTFPRFILAELNTHRMFSRNSASSRAIPAKKMVDSVKNNMFVPLAWQKEHPGMQGTEYFNEEERKYLDTAWIMAGKRNIEQVQYIIDKKATKQLANRLLEAYMWHTAIISFTEIENFFALRCPQYAVDVDGGIKGYRSRKDLLKSLVDFPNVSEAVSNRTEAEWFQSSLSGAEIHIQKLAELMWDAYNESVPKQLQPGEWHIPYGDQMDEDQIKSTLWEKSIIDGHEVYAKQNDVLLPEASSNFVNRKKIEIAVARCARVSYTIIGEEDKPADYTKDIALYDRLKASGHMSPFEHVAKAMNQIEFDFSINRSNANYHDDGEIIEGSDLGWSGNFRGFIQHRKTLPGENITLK